MDMIRMGNLLKELRKEKGMTQEQLAEQTGVARRTVSRWETGSNLPDLDILMELSDLYEVDLRELLCGERKSEKMDEELKEAVMQVADYMTMLMNKRKDAPILQLVKKEALENLLTCDFKWPWYGQLMKVPQTIAYMLQVNFWLEHYQIDIVQ